MGRQGCGDSGNLCPFPAHSPHAHRMCDNVVIPVSRGTAFDPSSRPLFSGVGKHEDCTIEKYTASSTSVEVRSVALLLPSDPDSLSRSTRVNDVTLLHLQVMPEIDEHVLNPGCEDKILQGSIATALGVNQWQNMQGGSSLLGSIHIARTVEKDGCLNVKIGENAQELREHQV